MFCLHPTHSTLPFTFTYCASFHSPIKAFGNVLPRLSSCLDPTAIDNLPPFCAPSSTADPWRCVYAYHRYSASVAPNTPLFHPRLVSSLVYLYLVPYQPPLPLRLAVNFKKLCLMFAEFSRNSHVSPTWGLLRHGEGYKVSKGAHKY